MHIPIDGDSRASEELSALMESLLADPDIEEPVTLGFVRDRLRRSLVHRGLKPDRSQFGTEQSLYAEIETLVEEFGEDAPAGDFTAVKASEALSLVIEVMLDEREADLSLTLGEVRDSMADGLTARLVGEGVVEDDQDGSLLAEIDMLIDRYGRETLAEELMRFE
ncbi:MAG: hypothetical protein ACLGII_13645 [Gammaproteobacteria bacterium]|mgnify:CR=1 FL=1|jgi:hypothetical protein|nr:MAG: hypothetical protein ABS55_12490 [Lautropia sp. SCN 70-15]